MAIGDNIKKYRQLRGFTQKKLGMMVGLSDTRIRQYELNIRTPKNEKLEEIANALHVNVIALTTPELVSHISAMFALFEIDEQHGILLNKENKFTPTSIRFRDYSVLQEYVDKWYAEKQSLMEGKITEEQYNHWKETFPQVDVERTDKKLKEARIKENELKEE